MSTISGVSPSTTYSATGSTASTTQTTSTAANAATTASTASAAAVVNPFTSTSANTASPLTYNATGLMNAFQQATANTPATSSAQNARNTYLAVQDAVTQALGSLMTDPNSSNSSNTDIFGASTTSNANDPFGFTSSSGTITAPGALPTTTTAKTAQNAYQAAQDAVTQSLNSIA